MHTLPPFKLAPLAVCLIIASQSALAASDIEVMEIVEHAPDIQDVLIDSDDLEKSQANDLNDVFRKEAEISVGGTSGVSQKIYVRGLEDTMLNITIDGAEQSSSLFHHQGAVSIEPELLKQVSASAGAGRATNGPGALGGAIQFETKDAQDLLKNGETFGGQVKTGYYSNSEGYKTSASVYGEVTENLGLLASVSYLNANDIKDGNGDDVSYTESEQTSGLIKLSGQLNERHYIALSYEYRDDSGERLNRPNWVESVKNPALDQESGRQTVSLKHGYTSGNLLNLDTTVYLTENTIKHIDHPSWGTTDGSIETYGAKVQNNSVLANHSLSYGLDFKHDSSDYVNISEGNPYEETGSVFGLFIQDDWQLTEKLLLTAGARYDWYELTDSSDTEFKSDGFSPNVGINYQPINNLNLFASYAQAIRGQQVKELFLIYAENDPDRKEEKATNAEIGANYQFNNFALGLTYFDSKIEDVVGYDYTSFTNLGELTNNGITAYVEYAIQPLTARLSYSQSNPELDGVPLSDDNTNIGTSMGDKWVLDVAYYATESLELGWTGTFVERFTDVADPDVNPEKPGYGVHDLYAQWLPLNHDDLKLTLSVKNVFDKYYYDHASYASYIGSTVAEGTPSAGRDFRFNVAYAF